MDSKRDEVVANTGASPANKNEPVATVAEPAANSGEPQLQQDQATQDTTVVTEISAIVNFAEIRLDSIHSTIPTIEQAKLGFQSLEKLKSMIIEFESILDRGVNALKDEEAKLLARLNEIKKARSSITSSDQTSTTPKISYQKFIDNHTKANTPKKSDSRLWGDESEDEKSAPIAQPAASSEDEFRNQKSKRGNRRGNRGGADRPRDEDRPRREYRMGERIPIMSPYPLMLNRRITLEDIREFKMKIRADKFYGQITSFELSGSKDEIGGIITVVPEPVQWSRTWRCEDLLFSGRCKCKGATLPPHAGHPIEVHIAGFVGIINKFLMNYNGNLIHPKTVSAVHIDAVLLRCVVHSIVQLLGIKSITTPIEINLRTFSDVAEPKNLHASMENYYRNRGDENPRAIARGLWIAIATHFVSS